MMEQVRPDYSINENYPNVKTIWEFNSGYTIGSSAIVKDKSVYIGDASGYFYSLSLLNGQ